MHDYRKLRVYQLSIDMIGEIADATSAYPSSQRFGLIPQMNRATSSISANIAEGAGRGDVKDFARFLRIARGSACELEAHLTASAKLGLLTPSDADAMRDRVERIKAGLTRLEASLKA